MNAEGGENEIHTHLDADHSFIVLEGRMSVYDEKGSEMVVRPRRADDAQARVRLKLK